MYIMTAQAANEATNTLINEDSINKVNDLVNEAIQHRKFSANVSSVVLPEKVKEYLVDSGYKLENGILSWLDSF